MKIHYVSDVHMEKHAGHAFEVGDSYKCECGFVCTIPECDVLILAGDIGSWEKQGLLLQFLNYCASKVPDVIYVLGNHEFHGGDLLGTVQALRGIVPPNVHILEQGSLMLNGNVEVFGTTMWTNSTETHAPRPCNMTIGNRGATTADTTAVHMTAVNWIFNAVQASGAATKIVVTHHMPIGPVMDDANEYKDTPNMHEFHADLGARIATAGIDYWISGHTHYSHRLVQGGTEFVSNQVGYDKEKGFVGYKDDVIITV